MLNATPDGQAGGTGRSQREPLSAVPSQSTAGPQGPVSRRKLLRRAARARRLSEVVYAGGTPGGQRL